MAEILEPNEAELVLDEGESIGDIEEDNHAVALEDEATEGEVAPEASTEPVDPEPEEELPEKFRGKSAAEIAQSYSDLERRMSGPR